MSEVDFEEEEKSPLWRSAGANGARQRLFWRWYWRRWKKRAGHIATRFLGFTMNSSGHVMLRMMQRAFQALTSDIPNWPLPGRNATTGLHL